MRENTSACIPQRHSPETMDSDTHPKGTNLTWHASSVTTSERESLRGHTGCIIWLTGLSGSGKSSVANAVERLLVRTYQIPSTYILDGDNIRMGLNADLGFSEKDRVENIRRIGHTANLFCNAGVIVLTAFISPYRSDRDTVRTLVEHQNGIFLEVYVQASLETCESRDPKGLYQKARAGEIQNFTGIDAPYEAPLSPDLILQSDDTGVEDLAQQVVDLLQNKGVLTTPLAAKTSTAITES